MPSFGDFQPRIDECVKLYKDYEGAGHTSVKIVEALEVLRSTAKMVPADLALKSVAYVLGDITIPADTLDTRFARHRNTKLAWAFNQLFDLFSSSENNIHPIVVGDLTDWMMRLDKLMSTVVWKDNALSNQRPHSLGKIFP